MVKPVSWEMRGVGEERPGIPARGAVSRAFARRSRQIFEWALLSSFEATSDDLGGSTETGNSDARRAFASTTSGDGRVVHAPESASPTRLGGDGSGAMPPRVASFWALPT